MVTDFLENTFSEMTQELLQNVNKIIFIEKLLKKYFNLKLLHIFEKKRLLHNWYKLLKKYILLEN